MKNWHIVFVALFLMAVVTISVYKFAEMNYFTLIALAFASFRCGRAIAFNFVFDWLRKPFTKVVKDSSGAGDSVEATGTGLRYAIGDMLCCPTCTGTWSAMILYATYSIIPNLGMALIYILAAAGLAETLHWQSEKNEWEGRESRENAGTAWMQKDIVYSERGE